MKDFIQWARTVRVRRARELGVWVAADRCGWIPGSARTRVGALVFSVRAYLGLPRNGGVQRD